MSVKLVNQSESTFTIILEKNEIDSDQQITYVFKKVMKNQEEILLKIYSNIKEGKIKAIDVAAGKASDYYPLLFRAVMGTKGLIKEEVNRRQSKKNLGRLIQSFEDDPKALESIIISWLECGGDPNTAVSISPDPSYHRVPLLFIAVLNDQKSLIQLLLKKGASPFFYDKRATSALSWFSSAVESKNSEHLDLIAHHIQSNSAFYTQHPTISISDVCKEIIRVCPKRVSSFQLFDGPQIHFYRDDDFAIQTSKRFLKLFLKMEGVNPFFGAAIMEEWAPFTKAFQEQKLELMDLFLDFLPDDYYNKYINVKSDPNQRYYAEEYQSKNFAGLGNEDKSPYFSLLGYPFSGVR